MKDVTDVLLKTQDIPSFPFNGVMSYEGIHVNVYVAGKVESGSIDFNVDEKWDIFDAEFMQNERFSNKRHTNNQQQEKIENTVNIQQPVNTITNVPSRQDKIDIDSVAYEYNSEVYIIKPVFRFVYTVKPEGSSDVYYCFELNKYRSLPDSTPKPRIKGEFNIKDNDVVVMESKNRFLSLFNINNLRLELDFINNINYYDRYELIGSGENSLDINKDKSEYNKASVDIVNDKFVVETEYDSEKVVFNIGLTSVGTLPDWVEKRLDVSMLISVIDSKDTLMAQIEPTEKNSNWNSENNQYELISLE